jgi:hypothetical protein
MDPSPSAVTFAWIAAFVVSWIATARGVACAAGVFAKPILHVDDAGLTIRDIYVPWTAIRSISIRRGALERFVGIDTRDNDALIRAASTATRSRFQRNIKQTGSPILIPPIRGLALSELRDMLEQRRNTATCVQTEAERVSTPMGVTVAPIEIVLLPALRWFMAITFGCLLADHSLWALTHRPSIATLLWAAIWFGAWTTVAYYAYPFAFEQEMRMFMGADRAMLSTKAKASTSSPSAKAPRLF